MHTHKHNCKVNAHTSEKLCLLVPERPGCCCLRHRWTSDFSPERPSAIEDWYTNCFLTSVASQVYFFFLPFILVSSGCVSALSFTLHRCLPRWSYSDAAELVVACLLILFYKPVSWKRELLPSPFHEHWTNRSLILRKGHHQSLHFSEMYANSISCLGDDQHGLQVALHLICRCLVKWVQVFVLCWTFCISTSVFPGLLCVSVQTPSPL